MNKNEFFLRLRTKLLLVSLTLAGIGFLLPLGASAAPLNYSGGTTVTVTTSSINYDFIVNSGSAADSLVVNATNTIVGFLATTGGSFTLTSASSAMRVSASDGGVGGAVSQSCSSAQVDSVNIRHTVGSVTYTIIPSGTKCAAPVVASTGSGGGSSSGGGGGGGGSSAVAVASPTPATPAAKTATPSAPVTIPALSANPTNTEVVNVLNAVAQQVAFIQANLSSPNALALLQDVVVQLAKLQTAVSAGTGTAAAAGPTAPPAGSYAKGLAVGAKGGDVTALQNLLSKLGLYQGPVSGYLGPLTQNGVKAFQEKYGIAQPGDAGYGSVGPKTRAKLNELLKTQ